MPEILPEIPGFRLTSAYRPAQQVGGDFFQMVPLEAEHASCTMIVLGDVSGKGCRPLEKQNFPFGTLRGLV